MVFGIFRLFRRRPVQTPTEVAKAAEIAQADVEFAKLTAANDKGELAKRGHTDKFFLKKADRMATINAQVSLRNHKLGRKAFVTLVTVAISIYFYTLYAVKQDDFYAEVDREVETRKQAARERLPQ